MRRIRFKLTAVLMMVILFSCDEPVTVVTNIVHADGSVTRKIEMRNSKNKFEKAGLQAPFDSTWNVKDSLEVGIKKDTTWIKRAEKKFKNVEEINSAYKNDSSVNGKMPRHTSFSKKFRWFNTEYRFSEVIDRHLTSIYPLGSFLNKEELAYFYTPEYLRINKEHGADSIKYRKLADSLEIKSIRYGLKNLALLLIDEFSRLAGPDPGPGLTREALNGRIDEFTAVIEANQKKIDSLWNMGILLKNFIGESNALKYRTLVDSSLNVAISKFLPAFNEYSLRIVMPGKLTGTNGYIDSTKNLFWPVKSDYFLTDQYEMWAESKTTNIWAWIVSGCFLIFVSAGIIIKRKNPARGGIQTIT